MKKSQTIWFLVILFIASSVLPVIGNADEVFVSVAQQNNHIRALAASCAACHGTLGNAVDNSINRSNADEGNAALAGIDAADFTTKMLGFREGSRKSTVMHHHAKGLSLDEINRLAVHFSQQKRIIIAPLKPQTLKAEHGLL